MVNINSIIQTISVIILKLYIKTASSHQSTLPPPCSSEIYCHGELLHTIQMASIFPDSKTFVDMKMKENSTLTLKAFNKLMVKTKHKPNVEELKQFLFEQFEPAGSEFEECNPGDWIESPKFLQKINDRDLKGWAEDLNAIWKFLCRKMKGDVIINTDLYSIISVPHPVIVPGGRFREFYYWDSYWIVKGLLLSEMYETVQGMLINFLSIVERYGFIPNGGRLYYLKRSQPPLLIPMFDTYIEHTKNLNFLKQNIKILEKEFDFWMRNHTVKIVQNDKVYTLCQYKDESSGPRPESYREDVISAKYLKDDIDKTEFYSELKTAAESGWDFSTRWFISPIDASNQGNLTNIKIKSIVPVDLNAIIYGNAKLLAKFYKLLNNMNKSEYYEKLSEEFLEAVTAILWRPEVGIWLDYDLENNKKRDYFYPSNFAPLWTNCYPNDNKEYYVDNVINYINKSGIFRYLGGIPSSLEHSGEQWDYPNAWPPLQHIMIMGLDNTNNLIAQQMAFELAEKWVRSNWVAYNDDNGGDREDNHHRHKAMYEKYDATKVGGHGGGGEYEVQLGFGWTNGVIMDLLNKYGDRIHVNDDIYDNHIRINDNLTTIPTTTTTSPSSNKPLTTSSALTTFNTHLGHMLTLLLAVGVTVTASCIGAIVYAKRSITAQRPDRTKYIKIPGAPNF